MECASFTREAGKMGLIGSKDMESVDSCLSFTLSSKAFKLETVPLSLMRCIRACAHLNLASVGAVLVFFCFYVLNVGIVFEGGGLLL